MTNQQPTLASLEDELAEAKQAESVAKEWRLKVEAQILQCSEVRNVIKSHGTTSVDRLKITTREIRQWDQEHLSRLHDAIKTEYFPFRASFTEDRKASKFIEEKFPALWNQIKEALTIKDAKPSVSIK